MTGRDFRPCCAVPHGEAGVPEGAPRSGEPATRAALREIIPGAHHATSFHSARNAAGVL